MTGVNGPTGRHSELHQAGTPGHAFPTSIGVIHESSLTHGHGSDVIDIMAQFVVRNLDDSIRDKIRALAAARGRSMEEEVREIPRAAVLESSKRPTKGLGTRLKERFQGCSLQDGEVIEIRGQTPRQADLDT